jgi:hypothetical protein
MGDRVFYWAAAISQLARKASPPCRLICSIKFRDSDMIATSIREYSLSPVGDGRGVSCDEAGAFIGAVPLREMLERIFSKPVKDTVTRVRIWTIHPTEPDQIWIEAR